MTLADYSVTMQQHSSLAMINATLTHYIDQTIAAAMSKNFIEDPVLGPGFSRLHSTLSSLVSRDGHVLQRVLFDTLKNSPYLSVWNDTDFAVSPEADRLAEASSFESSLKTDLPYGMTTSRTINLDLIVLDHRTKTVTAYELKRGKGYMGAGTRRQTTRDILCARMLIRGYARSIGFDVTHGDAKVIIYHGNTSLPASIALTGADLDDHFGVPVTTEVAAANRYFQTQLNGILPDVIADCARLLGPQL